jgi:hypothetical protein
MLSLVVINFDNLAVLAVRVADGHGRGEAGR